MVGALNELEIYQLILLSVQSTDCQRWLLAIKKYSVALTGGSGGYH